MQETPLMRGSCSATIGQKRTFRAMNLPGTRTSNVVAQRGAPLFGASASSIGLGRFITLSPWCACRLYRTGDVEPTHRQLIDLKSSDSCAANYEPTNGKCTDRESTNRQGPYGQGAHRPCTRRRRPNMSWH